MQETIEILQMQIQQLEGKHDDSVSKIEDLREQMDTISRSMTEIQFDSPKKKILPTSLTTVNTLHSPKNSENLFANNTSAILSTTTAAASLAASPAPSSSNNQTKRGWNIANLSPEERENRQRILESENVRMCKLITQLVEVCI